MVYVTSVADRQRDFEVYRQAGERARLAEPLYREDDGHYQFKYLPAFAVLAIPLGLPPPAVVKPLWYAASLLLLGFLLRTSVTILPTARHSVRWLVGVTFVLFLKFYAHEIELGQVNLLMAALVVGAAAAMRLGREWTAGGLVALAIVVKPYAALLLPYLLVRRRIGSIAGAGLGLAVALLLPIPLYGVSGTVHLLAEWWRTVTQTTAPNLADFNNVSAIAVFTRFVGPGSAAEGLAAATILVLLAVAAVVTATRAAVTWPEGLEVGLLLTMMPLISPQGWDYVFLIATPGVMLLVNDLDRLPKAMRISTVAALCVAAFLLFDLVGRARYRLLMEWSVIPLCYLVVIAALATLRFRRVA